MRQDRVVHASATVLFLATTPEELRQFLERLRAKNYASAAINNAEREPSALVSPIHSFRQVWEQTDLTANDFANEVALFCGLKRLSLPQLLEGRPLTAKFSGGFLRESAIYPFATATGELKLAVADPSDAMAQKAAEMVLGSDVGIDIASFEDIATVLGELLDLDLPLNLGLAERDSSEREENIDSLRDLASGAPVVRAINDLLEKAVELRASDIHIEPFRAGLTVRMRVDGLLRQIPTPPDVLPQALISRIKILAGLNIAERRLPQDGAARLHVARLDIDIRVATMPTQHGEAAAIRLLARDRGLLDISKLGLSPNDETRLRRLLDLPHGMIAITGPTGSGKTTTLATMLSVLNEPIRKILTIEDPVEYEIPGVNQSQIKPSIGLTFAAAMRAFVRQDPDVIMVGEVRDAETASIAIHAALTGHLVLTTLHTENAAAAVPRLLDLGVEAFLLRSTLRAVISQRLVRVLCERCKSAFTLRQECFHVDPRYDVLGYVVGETLFEPKGCERCGGTGYRGRVGVFEVLEVSGEVRDLVGSRSDSRVIESAAAKNGMSRMVEDAISKCRNGTTSVAEVLRVTTIR
jgi:general secretion pathway protein E